MAKTPAKKTPAPKKKTPAKKTTPRKTAPKKTAPKKAAAKATPAKKTSKTRTKPGLHEQALQLAKFIAQAMAEKKAENIRILDMRHVPGAVTDYFVICHGNSDKQAEAIARFTEEDVNKTLKQHVWHREGYENAEWILLDYIDVVAHIFQADKRAFYGIEELWGDAENVPFTAV